ncbi:hypothetical protein [Legionella feeleii]|uniref:Uncharacterized protein n=1 Tax=Legionella feeleii TaxID=453 RepID=A0A0W0TM50_9GAMM|nr:hypothetical protein [Legionella feeleii]KTC96671.1 hypothetical protein Lfee_1583 [Legionella feeleii]SPX60661.1 Uncharacterised protein [Legionella feeleii]
MGTSKEDLEKQLKKEEDLKKFILLQENEKRDQQQNEEYNQLLAQYGHEIVKNPSILQPVKGKEEEVDKSKLPMQDEFYIQSKKKGNNKEEKKEEEPIFSLAICRGSVCIPVDMDFATAGAYCKAANKLLLSDDPNDRAKGERAWDLLAQGKEAESMKLLGVGPIPTKKTGERQDGPEESEMESTTPKPKF